MSEQLEGSQAKLGKAPILPLIIKMSLPSMISMLIQALYNVVDSIYVSRLGENALSAVSLVYPIQLLYISVAVGTSIGLSSLISRRLGERRIDEAQKAADHGLILGLFHWAIFIIIGLFASGPFCRAFSETPDLIDPAIAYCTICCLGSIFVMYSTSYEKIMQGGGNMIAPMWSMIAGAVTNIILDPIMIFGLLGCPALGVAGAAYATVIGQAVNCALNMILMNKSKELPVKVNYKPFKVDFKIIKDIYQVGFPSIVMQSITSITTICLNAILVTFSETAVAVLGVYFKLQSFVFMPVFGMNHGLMPIMGYNFGARNKQRLLEAFKYGCIIALIIMTTGMFAFKLLPAQLMSLFDAEGELLTIGIKALSTISWCFPIAAVCIIMGTLFQATGHGFNSLIVSVMRQLVVIVPVAYLLSKVAGLEGIWYSYPVAEFISLAVSLILFIRLYKKEISKL
ncbi:MAG: MATE family efflux transporter [Bacillota bacterium]|nr:MATE family efflux transporter [Bacillota bacterium]